MPTKADLWVLVEEQNQAISKLKADYRQAQGYMEKLDDDISRERETSRRMKGRMDLARVAIIATAKARGEWNDPWSEWSEGREDACRDGMSDLVLDPAPRQDQWQFLIQTLEGRSS